MRYNFNNKYVLFFSTVKMRPHIAKALLLCVMVNGCSSSFGTIINKPNNNFKAHLQERYGL